MKQPADRDYQLLFTSYSEDQDRGGMQWRKVKVQIPVSDKYFQGEGMNDRIIGLLASRLFPLHFFCYQLYIYGLKPQISSVHFIVQESCFLQDKVYMP